MYENDTPTPGAPPTLDATQVAAFREAWVSAGHDPGQFDAALVEAPGGHQEPAREAGEIEIGSDLKTPSLTAQQAREIADTLLAQGVPEAAVRTALEADGYTLAADPRTDEQRAFDAFYGDAPASTDYRPNFMGFIPEGTTPEALAAYASEATTWASAMRLPVGVGKAVIERAYELEQRTTNTPPAERALWKAEQRAVLERQAGGPDAAAEWIAEAARVVAAGDLPFLKRLAAAGSLDDAWMIRTLANHGQALKFRG